jgi:DNA-binding CsgD family transcriptional regulator
MLQGACAVGYMKEMNPADASAIDLLARLTPGELRCLEMVASGMVSKEIARQLDISPHTVDSRLRAVTRKLGSRNRFVAAQYYSDVLKKAQNSADSGISNLIYEDLSLPQMDPADKMEPSPGNGSGPDEPLPLTASDQAFLSSTLHDERRPEAEAKTSHPLATFLGGENQLSVGRRLLWILGIAIGTAMAFTAIVNSLIGLSRLLSPP